MALRPRFSPGLPLSMVRTRVPAASRREHKNRQASPPLSRFRDLLPPRLGRPARRLASGFIASELRFNMERSPRGARFESSLLFCRPARSSRVVSGATRGKRLLMPGDVKGYVCPDSKSAACR